MRIYIAGICGSFMAGLARIATELGHTVGGCDTATHPPMSEQLAQAGISVDSGYLPSHAAAGWDCFVIGNALSRGNPLVEAILSQRLSYISGPEWLAREVLRRRRVLAVAGTHGKTTTAAMLSWILDYAGHAPGFLIGGVPANFGVSARAGNVQSDGFVIEADEYDTAFFDKRPKFLHYHPEVLVLNNLEFDHADIYENLREIERQFHFLLRTVPPDGVILYRSDDEALRRVLDKGVWSRRESFSVQGAAKDADWFAEAGAGGFQLFYRGEKQGRCEWSMPGEHNVANAVGAVAAAFHAGVEVSLVLRSLSGFRGVRRRLEVKGEASGITVYDDFAHHPSAIRASLEAVAGAAADGGRVFAVLEPHSNTMRMGRHRKEELQRAFAAADAVFCYCPGQPVPVLDEAIAGMQGAKPSEMFDDGDELLAQLKARLSEGDRVVFMSSGDFGGLPGQLARAFEGKRA